MTLRPLWACVRKEALLLMRDPHGLLLLFVMPAVFILIMSLALQDRFAGRQAADGGYVQALLMDRDANEASRRLADLLEHHAGIDLVDAGGDVPVDLAQRLRAEGMAFAVHIEAGFTAALRGGDGSPSRKLRVSVSPDADRAREQVLLGALREALGRLRFEALMARIAPGFAADVEPDGGPAVVYLSRAGADSATPSSVQQSVPAWLVFGVFFVVVPLSNTMIRERQLGMDARLRTTPVSEGALLLGKLVPYFVVNQLQVAAMLAVGVFMVPALGGDALSLAGVPAGSLALVSAVLSLAALGYALLIAVVSRTTEQATMLGGAGNIILAAIGGIMVPEFVMPPALQALTSVSPMAWGLEGLLTPLLHGGGVAQATPHALALAVFALITGMLAWTLQRYSRRY